MTLNFVGTHSCIVRTLPVVAGCRMLYRTYTRICPYIRLSQYRGRDTVVSVYSARNAFTCL